MESPSPPFVAVIAPGVERAFEQVSVNFAAMTHMRAKVLAIGIDHPYLAVLAPPNRQVTAEVAGRLDLAQGELIAPA
jgi:hypothetical protein